MHAYKLTFPTDETPNRIPQRYAMRDVFLAVEASIVCDEREFHCAVAAHPGAITYPQLCEVLKAIEAEPAHTLRVGTNV